MALYVGLDVSLKTTSICVVEADGITAWEGKTESEPAALIKAYCAGAAQSRWLVSKPARYQNGCTAPLWKAAFKRCASRPAKRQQAKK
jgi:hypothetical protein